MRPSSGELTHLVSGKQTLECRDKLLPAANPEAKEAAAEETPILPGPSMSSPTRIIGCSQFSRAFMFTRTKKTYCTSKCTRWTVTYQLAPPRACGRSLSLDSLPDSTDAIQTTRKRSQLHFKAGVLYSVTVRCTRACVLVRLLRRNALLTAVRLCCAGWPSSRDKPYDASLGPF